MRVRPALRHLVAVVLFLAAFAVPAAAKEESKIQIRLQPVAGSAGVGHGVGQGQVRGDVRTLMQGTIARLSLQVRGAAPNTEHVLFAKDDLLAMGGAELVRFTTGSNGQWSGSVDLAAGAGASPIDPRGRFLVLNDGAEDVLGGWLYGAAEDDGPKTKVKELTALAPDPTLNPSGSVSARYDRRPNGMGTFRVWLRGVPAGDYQLWVDGVAVAELTPNGGGNADAKFTTKPFHGTPKSKPHKARQQLTFDPRRKLVELTQGDQVFFSGPMLAAIAGVNQCMVTDSMAPLAPGPGQATGTGSVTLAREADCGRSLSVTAADLPAASYDLFVDGAPVGSLVVADDGAGHLVGSVVFDTSPDAPGEELLDFSVGSGSVVEIFAAGESAPGFSPLLTGTLP